LSADRLAHAALAWLVVVIAGRLFGRLAARAGQPPVIGEILSGIILGPSLLGWLAPGAEAALFPPEVRASLGTIAQAGVVLYMFLVGLEFDTSLLRQRTVSLVLTSQAAIAVPFALGAALAATVLVGLAPAAAPRTAFVLFMGVAMSITAFPVLARILADRGLTRSALGVSALACAAINDVMAWVLLAIVVGLTRAMPTSGVPGELVIAFAIGAAIPPHGAVSRHLQRALTGVVTIFLLPAFFALSGLRTQIGLVASPREWLICAAIILTATAGKLGGAALASRLSGMTWRFALRLGALMNTRGLMELIVLAVGLDAGVVSPTLFTMMVIMAIVTTAMTAPLLDLVGFGGEGDRHNGEERGHA
jgi:Kef-type K+ transport system membrane component KefB